MASLKGVFYSGVGRRLREARRKAGVTQEELAKAVMLSRASIVNIEKGRQPIDLHVAVAIAKKLQLSSVEELLPQEDERHDQLDDLQAKTRRAVERIMKSTQGR